MRYFLFILFGVSAFGAVPIPSDRRTDWIPGVTIGVSNGIPTDYTVWTNLVTAGADPTGASSCSTILQTLLNTAPSKSIIEVPTGRYLLGTKIAKNATTNHILLKGIGASRTNATFVATNGFLGMDSQNFNTWFLVHSNLVKGQTNFNVIGDLTFYPPGQNCRINVNNYTTNADVIGIFGDDRLMQEFHQIVSVVNGSNVTILPPLFRNYSTNAVPLFAPNGSDQSEFIGFENFTITGTNVTTGTGPASVNNVEFFGTRNWWWNKVRFENFAGFGLSFAYGCRTEIAHCDFVSSSSGANTACIISSGSSGDYLYDNYSTVGSPQVEYNNSSGSVIAYCYATNSVSNDFHVGNPFDNHQPHTHLVLWEGNCGEMFQSDSYFGSSDRQTLFRNFLRGYDPVKIGLPRCVDLGRWSQYYNIVANVLGDTRRATPWYFSGTNRYATYPDTQPVVYRFGFPFPGATAYGYSTPSIIAKTPDVNWNDPGRTNYSGPITSATANSSTVTGDMSIIKDGDILLIQGAGNTNFYYPFATNFSRLSASGDGTGAGLTFNKAIWTTNGDRVVRIGDGTYFYNALTIDYTNNFLIEGNWDDTNDVQVGTYFTTNTYHLTGGGLTQPSWWVGADGTALNATNWPPVDPVNGTHGIWPAQARNEGINGGATTNDSFQKVILGTGSNNMQTLIYTSNSVYGALFMDPSVVYKFNPDNLTSYITTNLFDGPIRDVFYSPSRHRHYWLVQNSSYATIYETDPSTLATNTVLLEATDVNDQIAMTSDDTYVWINGLDNGSSDGSVSQYRISNWTRVGYLFVTQMGTQRSAIGNYGGLLYWICKTNGHMAVLRAPTSNMTNYVFVESSIALDREQAHMTFSGNYGYTSESYFDGSGSYYRFHTNTLALEIISTGTTNRITDIYNTNGQYLWLAGMTNGSLGQTGILARLNTVDSSLAITYLPITNNIHSLVSDGTNRFFISTRTSPAQIYRMEIPSNNIPTTNNPVIGKRIKRLKIRP